MFPVLEFNCSSECNKFKEISSLHNGVSSKFSLGVFATAESLRVFYVQSVLKCQCLLTKFCL